MCYCFLDNQLAKILIILQQVYNICIILYSLILISHIVSQCIENSIVIVTL